VTTLRISAANRGQVIASNGTLVSLLYVRAPDRGLATGWFSLTDNGHQLIGLDLCSTRWAIPKTPGTWEIGDPDGPVTWWNYALLTDANIGYASLIVAAIPAGCLMDVVVE
jgi:hypothetical protein